jgi:hypothetical protein
LTSNAIGAACYLLGVAQASVTVFGNALRGLQFLAVSCFWANDDALKLARGIRVALDTTSLAKG